MSNSNKLIGRTDGRMENKTRQNGLLGHWPSRTHVLRRISFAMKLDMGILRQLSWSSSYRWIQNGVSRGRVWICANPYLLHIHICTAVS